MGILWYIIIFWLKLGVFLQISFFQKKILYQKFFLKFFENFSFALNSFLDWFMAKKKISKKFQKKFWPKKIRNFFQNLICEKVPSFSQKMMIYYKMPMSGVYENMFQTSEISIFPSLSNELLFTLCLRTPSRILTFYKNQYRSLAVHNFEIIFSWNTAQNV